MSTPTTYTMIAQRHKDGRAEVHENHADVFFVVQGKATLLTGGTVQDGKTVKPGEIRGKAVVNGVGTILYQGDIVHIPATVPINSCRGGTSFISSSKLKKNKMLLLRAEATLFPS